MWWRSHPLLWMRYDVWCFVWSCAECHQTCMSCSGPEPNQCTQCEKGLVLDPNTLLCGVTGDTDCPPRTYLHDDQFTCMGCHRHCYSCEGPGNDECQTCAIPKYLTSEHFSTTLIQWNKAKPHISKLSADQGLHNSLNQVKKIMSRK